MTHLFYEEYREELMAQNPLEIPQLVILDTRERMQPILKAIQSIPGLEWDDTDVIQTVMQAIQYENTAMSDLHNRCLGIVRRATGLSALEPAVLSTKNARPVAFDPYLAAAFRSGTLAEEFKKHTPGHISFYNEATALANLLYELGSHLYAQLRVIGCYTNGYLFYQFQKWIGMDMALVRFEVDYRSLR